MPGVVPPLIGRLGQRVWMIGDSFISWWLHELALIVPPSVSRFLMGEGDTLYIEPQGDSLAFRINDHATTTLVELTPTSVLPPVLLTQQQRADAVILRLPQSKVLRRMIDLPIAAASELVSAVPFLVERYTPFPLERARYTFRIFGRNKAQKTVTIELTVTARAYLDYLQPWLESRGIHLTAICVKGDDQSPALNLLPQKRRRIGHSWRQEPWKPILAIAALLLVFGPIYMADRIHAEANSLKNDVAALEPDIKLASVIKRQLLENNKTATFFIARTEGPTALEILNILSENLPDDTWIFDLQLTGRDVRLSGFSSDIPSLIGHLSTLEIFDTPEFASPATHGTASIRDRFDILTHLRHAPS